MGRASIADEGVEPPRDFKFFYKEHVDNKAKMEMWMGGQKRSIDVPFYITRDSLKGQLYNADELMKDFYGKTDRARILRFHGTVIHIYEMVFMAIRNQ